MADTHQQSDHNQQIRLVTGLAIMVALTLVSIKAIAWVMTGSVALLGSLLDSILDFGISFINFFAVRHAMTPPDYEHRFGHGKAEALAALAQGVIISASALFIIYEAILSFLNPQAIAYGLIGIYVIAISIILTLGLVFIQKRVARRTGSLAVSADSAHYEGDLFMNLAVIGALVASHYGDFYYADPALGVVVAGILFNSARHILQKAARQLMDHELNEETREKIKTIITAHQDVRGIHDLRTRRAGTTIFIQAHIELDGNMSLHRAHDIADAVEKTLMQSFPHAQIILHQDPEGLEKLTTLEAS